VQFENAVSLASKGSDSLHGARRKKSQHRGGHIEKSGEAAVAEMYSQSSEQPELRAEVCAAL